ncbi:transposase [Solibacillus sp. A46]|uniref:Transposase n=1 Tax=Solibacillus faecavium TaxID=2762221 RepID=A0ABR8XVZ9_9BACL|nr:transposase [Solibacillus faecavium]
MSNKTFSLETKISALKYLEEGRYSTREICKMFNLNPNRLYEWRAKYQFGGTVQGTANSSFHVAWAKLIEEKRFMKTLRFNKALFANWIACMGIMRN